MILSFLGKVWNYYKEEDIFALHLFFKRQKDLGLDYVVIRKDIIKMINWWLGKGIYGFRRMLLFYNNHYNSRMIGK